MWRSTCPDARAWGISRDRSISTDCSEWRKQPCHLVRSNTLDVSHTPNKCIMCAFKIDQVFIYMKHIRVKLNRIIVHVYVVMWIFQIWAYTCLYTHVYNMYTKRYIGIQFGVTCISNGICIYMFVYMLYQSVYGYTHWYTCCIHVYTNMYMVSFWTYVRLCDIVKQSYIVCCPGSIVSVLSDMCWHGGRARCVRESMCGAQVMFVFEYCHNWIAIHYSACCRVYAFTWTTLTWTTITMTRDIIIITICIYIYILLYTCEFRDARFCDCDSNICCIDVICWQITAVVAIEHTTCITILCDCVHTLIWSMPNVGML